MATPPILLLLGAGSNIGHHVARSFAVKGYKIALVSRSLKEEDSTQDQFNISSRSIGSSFRGRSLFESQGTTWSSKCCRVQW